MIRFRRTLAETLRPLETLRRSKDKDGAIVLEEVPQSQHQDLPITRTDGLMPDLRQPLPEHALA